MGGQLRRRHQGHRIGTLQLADGVVAQAGPLSLSGDRAAAQVRQPERSLLVASVSKTDHPEQRLILIDADRLPHAIEPALGREVVGKRAHFADEAIGHVELLCDSRSRPLRVEPVQADQIAQRLRRHVVVVRLAGAGHVHRIGRKRTGGGSGAGRRREVPRIAALSDGGQLPGRRQRRRWRIERLQGMAMRRHFRQLQRHRLGAELLPQHARGQLRRRRTRDALPCEIATRPRRSGRLKVVLPSPP